MNKNKDLMEVNNKKSLTFSVPSACHVEPCSLYGGKNSSLFLPFSLLTSHFSLFTSHQSPITNHHLQFPIFPSSHLPIFLPFSLLTSHFSPIPIHQSPITTHHSPITKKLYRIVTGMSFALENKNEDSISN